eukprot:5464267-Prymnesium_polylepis.1
MSVGSCSWSTCNASDTSPVTTLVCPAMNATRPHTWLSPGPGGNRRRRGAGAAAGGTARCSTL